MFIHFIYVLVLTNFVTGGEAGNCTKLKNTFGEAVSKFTLCSITNSHPIKLCQECIDEYLDMLNSYSALLQTSDDNGTICYNHYVNLDRLEIIETMYLNSQELWNVAKCNECFVVYNDTLTPRPSEAVLKFYDLYKNVTTCIGHDETLRNSSEICSKCMDLYTELSIYYHSISNENEKIAMCMDIVDLMNGTRTAWSDKCCSYRQHKEYIFIISTCLVLLLTLLFYTLSKLFVDKKSPVVFSQSRFAESFNNIGR